MAGTAQTHQIIRRMGAALGQRTDAVNLLHRGMSAVFEALLTQRMLRHLLGANTRLVASIPFAGGGGALIFFFFGKLC